MEFPEILFKLRKDRYISTGDLANNLNVSPSTISLWESGKRTPDYKTIIKLCDFFGVTADFLLGLNKDTTDTLVLNLIANDNIINSHADYYKKIKNVQYNPKEYITKQKNLRQEIELLEKDKNYTKEFYNRKMSSKNEELLLFISEDISRLNIKINELKAELKESQEDNLKKAREVDTLNNKYNHDMKIMHSLKQILTTNHYRNSIVYQILFLNDLGIEMDTSDVVYFNFQKEISDLYTKVLENTQQISDQLCSSDKITDILKYINEKSNDYRVFIKNDD